MADAVVSEAWRLWAQLPTLLSLRALTRDLLLSPRLLEWGADYSTGLRRSALTERLIAVLAEAGERDLRKLHLIAAANQRRLSNIARWMAIAYVTLPVSAAVTLSELDPDLGQRIADKLIDDGGQLMALGLIGLCVLYQIVRAWQGQQIVSRLEIAMLERNILLEPDGARG